MKSLIPSLAIITALALFDSPPSRGEAATSAVSAAPAEDAVRASEADARRSEAVVRKVEAEMREAEAAARKAEADDRLYDSTRKLLAQLNRQSAVAQKQSAEAAAASADAELAEQNTRYVDRLQTTIKRPPGGAAKALVIRYTDADPATQANLEEDLAVMSRVFDKAIDEEVGGAKGRRTAMGITVFYSPGSSPIRSLYLDGYGALFMLKVNFPLLAPPKATEESKEKPANDSSWEAAKRELYGQPGEAKFAPSAGEEYDADKVAKLKDVLLDALKSAANIRNLKSDDMITVCVFGGASTVPAKVRKASTVRVSPATGDLPMMGGSGGSGHSQQWVFSSSGDGGPMHGSTLTIRVKKSDVDAFAKGRLTLDEFRKKAGMAIYANSFDGGNAVGFGGGGFGGGFGSGSFGEAAERFDSFIDTYKNSEAPR